MQSVERIVKIISSFNLSESRLSLDDLTKKAAFQRRQFIESQRLCAKSISLRRIARHLLTGLG